MNSLRRVADCYNAILQTNYSNDDLIDALRDFCDAKEFETSLTASSRIASQADTELHLYLEDEGAVEGVDIPHIFDLIWELPRTIRQINMGRSYDSISTLAPTVLYSISALAHQKSTLATSQISKDIDWIFSELEDIDRLLNDSNIPSNLRHVIERQIAKIRLELGKQPVNPIVVSQELTSLAGMLAAATISEPDENKKMGFVASLTKISKRLLGEVCVQTTSDALSDGFGGFLELLP